MPHYMTRKEKVGPAAETKKPKKIPKNNEDDSTTAWEESYFKNNDEDFSAITKKSVCHLFDFDDLDHIDNSEDESSSANSSNDMKKTKKRRITASTMNSSPEDSCSSENFFGGQGPFFSESSLDDSDDSSSKPSRIAKKQNGVEKRDKQQIDNEELFPPSDEEEDEEEDDENDSLNEAFCCFDDDISSDDGDSGEDDYSDDDDDEEEKEGRDDTDEKETVKKNLCIRLQQEKLKPDMKKLIDPAQLSRRTSRRLLNPGYSPKLSPLAAVKLNFSPKEIPSFSSGNNSKGGMNIQHTRAPQCPPSKNMKFTPPPVFLQEDDSYWRSSITPTGTDAKQGKSAAKIISTVTNNVQSKSQGKKRYRKKAMDA